MESRKKRKRSASNYGQYNTTNKRSRKDLHGQFSPNSSPVRHVRFKWPLKRTSSAGDDPMKSMAPDIRLTTSSKGYDPMSPGRVQHVPPDTSDFKWPLEQTSSVEDYTMKSMSHEPEISNYDSFSKSTQSHPRDLFNHSFKPHFPLNIPQAHFRLTTSSKGNDPMSPGKRQYCDRVASKTLIDDRSCDAREIISKSKGKRRGADYPMKIDHPKKRQKYKHLEAGLQRSSSEQSEIDMLKHSIKFKLAVDEKTTKKVLKLLDAKSDIQYDLLITLIQALCNGNVERISKQLFASCTFWHHVSVLLCSMPQEKNKDKRSSFVRIIADITKLFKKLLETRPFDAFKHLPVDSCFGAVDQLSRQDYMFNSVEEGVTQLRAQRDEIRQELFDIEVQKSVHDEFALPSQEELHTHTLALTLRENIVKGPFPSNLDYISIFYSLLREDFIHPLREAIKKVFCNEQFLYENVTCSAVESSNDEIKCQLKFETKRKINWQYSKKLTYGSLLCLSDDHFATIFFATVSERDLDDLKDHCVVVTLIGLAARDPKCVSASKVYQMFESPCYYEAYAPVIGTLQSLREKPSNLPFQDYLVNCKTVVKKPKYLEQNPEAQFSLTNVICSCDPPLECQHASFSIEDIEKGELNNSCLSDPSQAKALCTALTRELVLIQGPPGTGKTYIGLKIVQSFLINKILWNASKKKPIIIVCYTNHALDQFLEGLVKIKDDIGAALQIRRVGGRSKSTMLEPFNVKKYMNMMKRQKGIKFTSKNSLRTMQSRTRHLEEFLGGILPSSKEAVASYSFFLSKCIVSVLRQYCNFKEMILPSFPELVPKAVEENPFHDQIESERHFSFDDDQYSDFRQLLEEKSLKKFVTFFHRRITSLHSKEADKTFEQLADDGFICSQRHLQLFKFCLTKLLLEWQKELDHAKKENAQNDKRVEMIRVGCLQNADVVGLTINGAAKFNAALTQVKSKICIIEEAGEVMEPHVITSLTQHTEQLILIGDHKQLRPKTNCDTIGRKYKLDISLFERLVINDFPVITLKIQHRMRPEISRLVSNHVYDGCIENSESVKKYERVTGVLHSMYFINHHEYETRDEDESSPFNIHEATFVVHLCKYLVQIGHKLENITIITPYLGQLREIKQQSKIVHLNVKISTVDNFQGQENDIILLSLVRSNKEEDIGFTRFKNRVCVAMSRAKKGFYCIGNFSAFKRKSKLWKSISSDLEKDNLIGDRFPLQCITHNNVTHVSNATDIKKVLSDGCGEKCTIRLPVCNHACNRFCHPDDQAHNQDCTLPCPKRCDNDLHRCASKCGLKCPPCKQLVEKVIPKCGHKQQVPCNVNASKFSCTEDCNKTLLCGHPCKLKCGQECSSQPCKFFVKKKWACGHSAQRECHESTLEYSLICNFPCDKILACDHKCSGKCGKCHQGRLHVPCKEKCTKSLVCGHPCSEPCAKNCLPCTENCVFKCPHALCRHKCSKQCKPCPHPCEWKCVHFQCSRNCGEQCDRERCSKPCKKKLNCKHDCIGLCGEPCPSVCRICDKESEVFVTFFGEEDGPDSRFIELKDCKHVIEASALDGWIDTGTNERHISIKWKTCPKCTAPVISTLRYANEAKKVLADMNRVKDKEHYTLSVSVRKEHHKKASELSKLAYQLLKSQNTPATDIGKMLTEKFRIKIENFRQVDDVHNDALLDDFLVLFQSLHRSLLTLQNIADIFSSKTMERHEIKMNGIKWLNLQTKDFLKWLLECSNRNRFTDQVRQDSSAESKRIFLLGELYFLKYRSMKAQHVELSEHENDTLCRYKQYECFGCHLRVSVTDNLFEQALCELNLIAKKFDHPLSKAEKNMIIKAMDAKRGSWYKCQNGHFYQIGECGGAMETSMCPECSAVIGGEHHSLASGNQHAEEFDGSSYPAWSEGANLANYEGLN